MTEYTFSQLVDIAQVRQLLESHHRLSGMAYGIFDTDENCLIAVEWQDICVRFHRVNPVSMARCRESDAFIKEQLQDFEGEFFEYRCRNGMIDVAMPIIIDGKHLATFFTGQFFYDDDLPDEEYFLMQAEALGFDLEEYLKALKRVPVFSREHIRANVLFLHNMVRVMAEMGLNNLRLACEVAERKRAEKRLTLLDYALNHVKEAAFLIDNDGDFLYVNEEACRRLGYCREELLQLSVADVDPDYHGERWADHWSSIAEHGALTFEGRHRTRDGCIFPAEINANYFEYDGQEYNLALARDISERKRLENEVKSSRDFLSNVINAIADPVFVKDAEHRLILANDAECALAGCSRDKLLGRTDYDFFPKEQVDNFWKMDDQVLAGGEPIVNEELITEAAGSVRTIVTHKSRYIDPQGNRFVVGVVRDITERKKIEHQFRLLNFALDHIREAAFLFDEHARIHYVNDEGCRWLGYGRDRLLGMGVPDIDADITEEMWREVWPRFREMGALTTEARLKAADGRIFPVEVTGSYFEWDGAGYNLALMRDITERKRMEDALRESEQQYRNLAESLPDNVIRYDRDCRATYSNSRLTETVAIEKEEFLGKTLLEAHPETAETAGLYESKIRQVLAGGAPGELEIIVPHPNGGLRTHLIRIVAERGAEGAITGAMAIGRDITAIKEAEQQLRETRSRLSAMFTTIPDLVWLKNPEGVYLACNPAFERFFGATEAEIAGKTDYDFVDKELADFFVRKDREAIAAGTVCVNEEEITYAADGRQGVLETRKVPVYDADGTVVGVLGIARDITKRKQMEDALAEREKEFRTLAENAPDVIVRYDRECRRIYVNPAFERVNRLTAQEVLGKTPIELSTELAPLADDFTQYLKEVLETGVPKQIDLVVAKGGIDISWFVRLIPESDPSGEVVSALTIWTDITERKRMEEALTAGEQRFRDIFDNSLDCLYLLEVTEDGRFRNLEINPALERSTGMTRAELIGKYVDETVSGETGATVVAKYRCCVESGAPTEEEVQLDLPSGRRFYHSTLIPVRNDNGRVHRIVGITRDITEHRRHELLEKARLRLFEQLAHGAALPEILDHVVAYAETFCPEFIASIMLIDADEKHLLSASGPRLPKDYAAAVNGIEIGEGVGSCGTAVWRGETVIADDVRTHPFWAPYKHLALKAGFLSCWSEPIFDSSGKAVGTFGIYRREPGFPSEIDRELIRRSAHLAAIVIEHKRMEEQLRVSEQQFRTLAENSPNIIIRYDRDCRRVYVNPAYERETEIPATQALNVTPDTLWRPTMPVKEYKEKLRLVMESGIPARIFVEWSRLDDGRITHHAFHVVAERDVDGQVTGCLAIGHNITALREAELRLSKLAASVPGFLYTYRLRPDGTACLPYASPQIKDIYGFPPEAATEDASETLARIHPDDVSRVRDSIVESARTLSLWHAEYRIRHPEKGDIWVEGRSMPEVQPDGGIVWFGFVNDITERKRIEESLRVKREQLSAMTVELSLAEERERRRIASELHDHIGQTLLLSRIKLGTLADVFEYGSDEKTYEEIQTLLEQTIRDVRSLTQQLNPPVLASVGLDAALEWLAKRMEVDYSLLVDFVDDRCVKPLTEELNSVVYQSARELLINVAKHAGTNEARLTIGREADMLMLTVEDQGCGFECLPDPGTNMPLDCSFGLFNIRQRIKLLGGNVVIESEQGRGTCATIRVPLAESTANPP